MSYRIYKLLKCILRTKCFILCFLCCSLYAQNTKNFINNIINKVFINLYSNPLVYYKLTFTTLEVNNVTSTVTAEVYEDWSTDSSLSLYKFNTGQLFVVYMNNLGLERFWFGKVNDLPEIKAKEIDNKILTTGVSYSSFVINPLWLSVPVDYKEDKGFLVIQAYNTNRYSNYNKIEYYINKDYIPVRVLYYNNISNFPVIEILVNKYQNIGNGFIISEIEFRDNTTKKTTIVKKTDINFNVSEPLWLQPAKNMIYNNIKEYHTSFLLGIRTKDDIYSFKDSLLKMNNLNQNNSVLNIPPTYNQLQDDNTKETQNNEKSSQLLENLLSPSKLDDNNKLDDNKLNKTDNTNEKLLNALSNLAESQNNEGKDSPSLNTTKKTTGSKKRENQTISTQKNTLKQDCVNQTNTIKSNKNTSNNVKHTKQDKVINKSTKPKTQNEKNKTKNKTILPENNIFIPEVNKKEDSVTKLSKENDIKDIIAPPQEEQLKQSKPIKKNKETLLNNLF